MTYFFNNNLIVQDSKIRLIFVQDKYRISNRKREINNKTAG